ncbi:MAG TPA: hypothetical protein VFP22_07280 [Candidatus Limnocylindrales bacterium]|nr:hypothetical protein [Candidatus Limnocylindrales bacterium]
MIDTVGVADDEGEAGGVSVGWADGVAFGVAEGVGPTVAVAVTTGDAVLVGADVAIGVSLGPVDVAGCGVAVATGPADGTGTTETEPVVELGEWLITIRRRPSDEPKTLSGFASS